MMSMQAFHNDPRIKTRYLSRVRAHRKADEIVQNYGYWKEGKGCAVGCTLHSGEHAAYETELGIPRIIARLEDGIFEGLPTDDSRTWPERFLEAIPVGANLSKVSDRFLHWLLVDPEHGVIRHAKTDKTKTAIQGVANHYADRIVGIEATPQQWRLVREAAWEARRAAADAAADAYAAYAADAAADAYAADAAAYADAYAAYAADAAADAYAYAAYAAYAADAADAAADAYAADAYAAYADAYAAARRQSRVIQSQKLLELLANA